MENIIFTLRDIDTKNEAEIDLVVTRAMETVRYSLKSSSCEVVSVLEVKV